MDALKGFAGLILLLSGVSVFAQGSAGVVKVKAAVGADDKVLGADGKTLNTPQAALQQLDKAKKGLSEADALQRQRDKKAFDLEGQ